MRDSLSCAVLDYHRTKHDPCSKGAQNIGETVLSYVFVFTNIAHCSSLSIFFREKSSGIDKKKSIAAMIVVGDGTS